MFSDNYKYIDTYNLYLIETTVIKGVLTKMKKTTSILSIGVLIIISITILSLIAINNSYQQLGTSTGNNYGRDSDDFEVLLIYATLDGMETKYKAQSPIVMPKDYLACEPESQYDYIMNGEISLLNEYGARITYSFSAYIMNQSGYYYVVDSIVY